MSSGLKPRAWRNSALCGLVLLLLIEILVLQVRLDWLWTLAKLSLSWSDLMLRLEKCEIDIAALKSQHLAVLVFLLPLKAVCVFMYSPAWIKSERKLNLFEKAWRVLNITLYSLLGLVFAYVFLFLLPASPTLAPGSFLGHLYLCNEPTLRYALSMAFASFIAAVCLWPIVLVAVTLVRSIWVRVFPNMAVEQ